MTLSPFDNIGAAGRFVARSSVDPAVSGVVGGLGNDIFGIAGILIDTISVLGEFSEFVGSRGEGSVISTAIPFFINWGAV